MKRIVCLGGGPAGLYAAILLRKALPAASVEVYERNRPDDTFGWGVVFSDQTMENFRTADPELARRHPGGFPSLGRYRHSFRRPPIRQRRPWIRRHQPQTSAGHSAGARARTGSAAAVRA